MSESELAEIRARVPTTGDGMDRLEGWFCEHACEDGARLLGEVDRLRGLLCRGVELNVQARMAAQSDMGYEDWLIDVNAWLRDTSAG